MARYCCAISKDNDRQFVAARLNRMNSAKQFDDTSGGGTEARPGVDGADAQRTAEMVARRSYGKLVAFLAARTRDVAAAEDALSDAFASAIEDWARNGCPENPEAWLLTVARRKTIDNIRRRETRDSAEPELKRIADGLEAAAGETSGIPDRRLGLMFACAHPAIEASVRSPLILQVVLGLDAKRIASAFLVSPAAMGQRLVRAKEKIRQAGIPFRIPEKDELPARLDTVLDAIYAAFAEAWGDPVGNDVARRDLSEEAIYLGRVVVELLPDEPETLGLLALMLHAEARRKARRNGDGEYVPLAEQDTSTWDFDTIAEAEELLLRASKYGVPGRYQLEAALQSAHVHRIRTGVSNWREIVELYGVLFALTGSPVVAVNRVLAVAETEGPQIALAELDKVAADSRLAEYQPYWAVRAELLAKMKKGSEAHAAYQVAIGLERDPAVRRFLQRRQDALPASR
jgi:predicted RNA polymerase sigma factor